MKLDIVNEEKAVKDADFQLFLKGTNQKREGGERGKESGRERAGVVAWCYTHHQLWLCPAVMHLTPFLVAECWMTCL